MEYHLRFAPKWQIQKYAGNELESSFTFFVSLTLIAVLGAGTKLLERHLPRHPSYVALKSSSLGVGYPGITNNTG